MPRFAVRCVLITVLAACPAAMAADVETLATHCEESEIVLDAEHSVATLGRCGDSVPGNLLWHLDRIDQLTGALDGRFTRRNRGAGSVIYVVDTGVLSTHAEFATPAGSRVIAGFDVAQAVPFGESPCRSPNKATAPCFADYSELSVAAHGTSVASLAAGRNVGVAPDASIVAIRVMNERGLSTTRAWLAGLDAILRHAWSVPEPVSQTSVVNISGWVLDHLTSSRLEVTVPYAAIERRMRDMIFGVDAEGRRDPRGRRFLFVVAGNNVEGGCGPAGVVDRFPAVLGPGIDGVITVGGMTADNSSWTGSCRGGIEVLAPAQSVFSATITANDHYRGKRPDLRSGTSFAAAVISGVAALILSEHPELTPEQVEAQITATQSRVLNPDESLANGKVGTIALPAAASRPVPQQQGRLAH